MTDTIIEMLIKQLPAVAALLALVIIFIKYISKRDTAHNNTVTAIVNENDARLQNIIKDFREHTNRSIQVQEQSIKATEKNSVILEDVKGACTKLNDSVVFCQKTQEFFKNHMMKEK